MRQLTCDPDLEILGRPVLGFVDNVRSNVIYPYLERHNLVDIQPDQWYPAQLFLDVLNDLAAESTASMDFVAIGMGLAAKIIFPPEMENASLEDILLAWGHKYDIDHRGPNKGYLKVEIVEPGHIKSIHKHPYPDDFEYGLAYGLCRRFRPEGVSFRVYYDEDTLRMDQGGEETIIHVVWGDR